MPSEFEASLICYPYYSSKTTGRGHDRYICELYEGVKQRSPQIRPHLLHQGFSKKASSAVLKQPKLIMDLLAARFDLYHAMSPIGGATAALLGKHPLVVTIHDMLPFHYHDQFDYGWKLKYYRLCTRTSAKKADALVVPYEVTKKELIERFRVPEEKIHVVSYGVDHSTYFPRDPRRSPNETTKTVLYIGEVSRSKGVDSLLRAYALVERQTQKEGVRLLIGGKSSKDQPRLESLATSLGLQRVTFLGYVPEDELPLYYSSADVMVYPSRYGFGLSTLEAMACGTPVVVGAVLDAPEFVADSGVLVDPDDIDQMAAAVLRIISEPELAGELATRAVQRAQQFSWSRTAEETASLYQALLS